MKIEAEEENNNFADKQQITRKFAIKLFCCFFIQFGNYTITINYIYC